MKKTPLLGTLSLLLLAVAVGGTGASCKKKEALSELKTEDKPAVDPELANAVAAASASAAPAGSAAAQEGGPPATGVFGPGAADRELPRGSAPKVTLGGEGELPRARLVGVPALGRHELRVRVVSHGGGRQGVPLDLGLTLVVAQPKAAGDAGVAPAGLAVTATVEKALVDAARLSGQVPKELETSIAELKGAKVEFVIEPTGSGRDFTVKPPKKATNLGDLLNPLANLLATVALPYPDKPVGTGAVWMATTREHVLGIDTVAYRLIKVEGFEGSNVVLKIDTKRYAADSRQTVPALAESGAVEFQQFKGEGTGTLTLPTTGGFPVAGTLTQDLASLIIADANPQQPLLLQERVEGSFENPAAAAAAPSAAAPAGAAPPPPAPAAP